MESSSGSQLGKNSKTSDGRETKATSSLLLLITAIHFVALCPKGENEDARKEVNSTAQNFVHFTEEEEDIVFRMHRLVGNRWELIAGRIPGRTAEEVEKFWAIKHQAT
uniref:Uncharacterized protein n=1 Tax=Oryza barthii TaxID=65489 RepID=A0A0D3ERB3_9ORYZ